MVVTFAPRPPATAAVSDSSDINSTSQTHATADFAQSEAAISQRPKQITKEEKRRKKREGSLVFWSLKLKLHRRFIEPTPAS